MSFQNEEENLDLFPNDKEHQQRLIIERDFLQPPEGLQFKYVQQLQGIKFRNMSMKNFMTILTWKVDYIIDIYKILDKFVEILKPFFHVQFVASNTRMFKQTKDKLVYMKDLGNIQKPVNLIQQLIRILASPGFNFVNPCTENLYSIDCKIQIIECPRQSVITRDNILVFIDASTFYRILIPKKCFYNIANYQLAIKELTQATVKTIAGIYTLQQLLEKRDEISEEIKNFVEKYCWDWVINGINIDNILIKDITMNDELNSILSEVAKQQRISLAKVINAKADVQSANLMRQSASYLSTESAMQIRYLETVSMLGNQVSTKVVFLDE